MNTVTDFIDVAEYVVKSGYTKADRLVANGGSAGGLLMGAVANMRPDLFKAIVADVPFVDVINTMLDASLPLTAQEWEQWGNPQNADAFASARYERLREVAFRYAFILDAVGLAGTAAPPRTASRN